MKAVDEYIRRLYTDNQVAIVDNKELSFEEALAYVHKKQAEMPGIAIPPMMWADKLN